MFYQYEREGWEALVSGQDEAGVDVVGMVVPQVGALVATGFESEPWRLVDASGVAVKGVAMWLADLQASDRSVSTLRSYGMDLLRWFRFLWALGVSWERATRVEARDYCRWLALSPKPTRAHWRGRDEPERGPNIAAAGNAYSASVRAHSETVLRCFYDFHRDIGSGPVLNPFPLERSAQARRPHVHHNPMEPHRNERVGLYRPRMANRIPRSIPDDQFNDIFSLALASGPGIGSLLRLHRGTRC